MTQPRSIVAFIATNAADRAKPFYRDVLELTLLEDAPFALVFELNGTMLRIQKTQGYTPAPHTALGIAVSSIDDEVRKLQGRGVVFERFAGMEQDSLGVWRPPGTNTKVAWFKDPDGNLLSLTQFD